MFKGGIADKLGNRYESKWTVRCLMDVASGKAKWLVFEGLGTEYGGFEFARFINGRTEWHQTKINCSTGNWTINALASENVLKAFAKRLSQDVNAVCFFVSQDNAKDFRTITDKSRMASDINELKDNLSKDQKKSLEELKTKWNVKNEVILFDWLKRSMVEIIPERELDDLINSYGGLYFQGASGVYPFLRDILEENFNVNLTPELLKDKIDAKNTLIFKSWLFDSTVEEKVKAGTESYLQSYLPFGFAGEVIERKVEDEIVDSVLNCPDKYITFVTGSAGTGKSGVNRGAIRKLVNQNISVLAFRIDQFLSCRTKEELGLQLTGREESPVATLKILSPEKLSVIFIDQLDAISDISGRGGDIKKVIFQLLSDAKVYKTVKVVMSCRTFDLNNDARLLDIFESDSVRNVVVPMLNWEIELKPLLIENQVKIKDLTEKQKQLLSLPINLAIFLNVYEDGFTFNSTYALYNEFLTKKQRHFTAAYSHKWALIEVLGVVSKWMSENQNLYSPTYILDNYVNAVDLLTSEGLINSAGNQLNFFHESFFDYIYARSFVTNDHSIAEMLISSEQNLFRRTQVRQILEALRDVDMRRYVEELAQLLTNTNIRYHIKSAIAQWLRLLKNPTADEFELLNRLNEDSDNFDSLFKIAVLSPHGWFHFLTNNGWIKKCLAEGSEQQVSDILWFLSACAENSQKEVQLVLREVLDIKPELINKIFHWFRRLSMREHAPDLLNFYIELIELHPKTFLHENIFGNMSMPFYGWTKSNPEFCGKLLKTIYSVWCKENPDGIPFARDTDDIVDSHVLSEVAKSSPIAFVDGTTDVLIHAITAVLNTDEFKHKYNFSRRAYSGINHGFDDFLAKYRNALVQVAKDQPEMAKSYLLRMTANQHECYMHLYLEVITANPGSFFCLLPGLIENELVFESGYDGAKWLSFANAYKAAAPLLSVIELEKIERKVLVYIPEIKDASYIYKTVKGGTTNTWGITNKTALYYLNKSGYTQWCIFETVGESLLTYSTKREFARLRRKFPNCEIEKPNHNMAYTVSSPLPKSATEKMDDMSWLSAIAKYESEWKPGQRSLGEGGAIELAGSLSNYTVKNPKRFAALCLRIPVKSNPTYISSILSGLSNAAKDDVPDLDIINAINYAHSYPEKPFGDAISRLLRAKPYLAINISVLDALIWYAQNGEASDDEIDDVNITREATDIDSLLQGGSRLHIRGINGTRGSAWDALHVVLAEVPSAEGKIIDALKYAVKNEPLISVRCCMFESLVTIFNKDKNLFSDLIYEIFPMNLSRFEFFFLKLKAKLLRTNDNAIKEISKSLSPLITHAGIRLFPYMFFNLPDLAKKLVYQLINFGDYNMQLIGIWLIYGESFRNEGYIKAANSFSLKNPAYKKIIVSVVRDVIGWADNKHRAEALLKEFFNDTDDKIRSTAAFAFSNIESSDLLFYKDLCISFINSQAFIEHSSSMLYKIEDVKGNVSDIIIQAADRIIKSAIEKKQSGDRSGLSMHQLQDQLKSAYLASEGNMSERKQILDLMDLMLMHEIYGAENITNIDDRF